MRRGGCEYTDPNYGLCPDAVEVLAWQALASTEPTTIRAAAIARADELIGECRRCVNGSLLNGDPMQGCTMAGLAIKFTSLGPVVKELPECVEVPVVQPPA